MLGANGARGPSVSPDGRWIAFTAGGQLRKGAVDGGAAIRLADSVETYNASPAAWLDDGTVVYVDQEYRLRRVSAAGGESRECAAAAKRALPRGAKPSLTPIVADSGRPQRQPVV